MSEHNPYEAPAASSVATAAGGLEPAGFLVRFAAAFVDGIISGIIGGVFGFVVGFTMGATPAMEFVSQLGGIVIGWLFGALFESGQAMATPGKRMLGLKVVGLDGRQISFGRATGRHFAKIPSGLIFGIGFLMAAFTEKKQALHDIMAGCRVVKR